MFAGLTLADAFSPLVTSVAIVAAAIAAALYASRDLSAQRRLESTDRLLDLVSIAHGRPRDGREHVGTVEQVAALHLIAEFGRDNKWMRPAASEALEAFDWLDDKPALAQARTSALVHLRG